MAGRGRPPKFGRPAELLALTLPQDTIEYLQTVDADLGWAIVKLAGTSRGSADGADPLAESVPDVALVPIGPRQSLIVVRVHEAFSSLPDVDLIPLGRGQAFLAFRHRHSLEGLELALIDRLEDDGLPLDDRARFASFRDVLRSWRRDASLAFHERTIVVVERRHPLPARRKRGPA